VLDDLRTSLVTESTALTVDGLSLLMVWTAIGVYALAFAAYAIDLAVRVARVEVPAAELVSVGTPAPPVAAPTAAVQLQVPPRDRERLVWARIGTALTILGFVLQLSGDVLRGIAAARVPWANMYEFALTGTLLIVGVFLFALRRYDLRFLGSFLLGMVVLLLGGATLAFYVEVTPLMDPLRSVWLVIHVFVASLATALFAIACGLSVTQVLQHRRENRSSVNTRGVCFEPCPPQKTWKPWPTGSPSLASSFGLSPSLPALSGQTTPGGASGVLTLRRCGLSSSGCCMPGTSTPVPPVGGAVTDLHGCP